MRFYTRCRNFQQVVKKSKNFAKKDLQGFEISL